MEAEQHELEDDNNQESKLNEKKKRRAANWRLQGSGSREVRWWLNWRVRMSTGSWTSRGGQGTGATELGAIVGPRESQ